MALNSIVLQGNLVKEPESRVTKDGKEVATFTLAVGRNYKDLAGAYPTDFFNCICFGKTAKYIINKQYTKGQPLLVQGSLYINKYEDKNKNLQTRVTVTVDRLEQLNRKEVSSMQNMGQKMDEEIPF